ncbi:hypothetical protein CRE_01708 [Caenorhabditis remanei]|uniref:Uncharacterized protein n=1 Tax=Caenorhabditis remanei TaxID=31234 RepID=E3LF15_CAERE|nr:hypothetical protein CRE_01708 [Caenorhabditis remanei]
MCEDNIDISEGRVIMTKEDIRPWLQNDKSAIENMVLVMKKLQEILVASHVIKIIVIYGDSIQHKDLNTIMEKPENYYHVKIRETRMPHDYFHENVSIFP